MEETELLVQFIRENQACFYRVAYSYVKESQTAMDLVQDAIVKALQKYAAPFSSSNTGNGVYMEGFLCGDFCQH